MKQERIDLTPDSLVRMAREKHDKVMKDAESRELEHKKKVEALGVEEKARGKEIAKAKEQHEKMCLEFDELERVTKKKMLADAKELELTVKDVKEGRITMAQFQARGKEEEDIKKTTATAIAEVLEGSVYAIREVAESIVRLELSRAEIQNHIYTLLVHPVRIIKQSYRDLADMLDFQLSETAKIDHEGTAQSLVRQKKNELTLIEGGVSVMSSGYIWSDISLEEAYRLRLNPIMPKDHVVSLLRQLDEIEPGEKVRLTITYHQPGSYWPGDPVEVREEL